MDAIVNSLKYWDDYFNGGNRDKYGGEGQSAFFAGIAIAALPDKLKDELLCHSWTFADWGCAYGSGTAVFAKQFP